MSSVGKPDTHSFTWPEDGEEPPAALVPVVFAAGLALPLLEPSDGDPAAAGVDGVAADAAADVGEDGVACESTAEVRCAPGDEAVALVGTTGTDGLALDVVGRIGGTAFFAEAPGRACELLAAAALSAHDIGAAGPSELASDAGAGAVVAAAELVAAGSAVAARAAFGVPASGVEAPSALATISVTLPFGDGGACADEETTELECKGAMVSGCSATWAADASCDGDGSDGTAGATGTAAGDAAFATVAGNNPWCNGAWCCGRAGQLGS